MGAGALVGLAGLRRAAADHAAAEAQHDLVQVHELDEVAARRLRKTRHVGQAVAGAQMQHSLRLPQSHSTEGLMASSFVHHIRAQEITLACKQYLYTSVASLLRKLHHVSRAPGLRASARKAGVATQSYGVPGE